MAVSNEPKKDSHTAITNMRPARILAEQHRSMAAEVALIGGLHAD